MRFRIVVILSSKILLFSSGIAIKSEIVKKSTYPNKFYNDDISRLLHHLVVVFLKIKLVLLVSKSLVL